MKGPQKEVEAVLRLLLSSMYTAEASASLSSAFADAKGVEGFSGLHAVNGECLRFSMEKKLSATEQPSLLAMEEAYLRQGKQNMQKASARILEY